MRFGEFWQKLLSQLYPGLTIRNWTVAKGYLGDEFIVASISNNAIKVESPNATNIQNISRGEFEIMFNNWEKYCSGQLQRQHLRDLTRFSKYTMSIIKHNERLLSI